MALVDDFKNRFPEFDAVIVDEYIPILEDVWPCYYGGSYSGCCKEIILNLLGHLITVETTADSSSPKTVASKSVGNVSLSYAPGYTSMNERDAWLKSTKYGARYLWLTSRNIGGYML